MCKATDRELVKDWAFQDGDASSIVSEQTDEMSLGSPDDCYFAIMKAFLKLQRFANEPLRECDELSDLTNPHRLVQQNAKDRLALLGSIFVDAKLL